MASRREIKSQKSKMRAKQIKLSPNNKKAKSKRIERKTNELLLIAKYDSMTTEQLWEAYSNPEGEKVCLKVVLTGRLHEKIVRLNMAQLRAATRRLEGNWPSSLFQQEIRIRGKRQREELTQALDRMDLDRLQRLHEHPEVEFPTELVAAALRLKIAVALCKIGDDELVLQGRSPSSLLHAELVDTEFRKRIPRIIKCLSIRELLLFFNQNPMKGMPHLRSLKRILAEKLDVMSPEELKGLAEQTTSEVALQVIRQIADRGRLSCIELNNGHSAPANQTPNSKRQKAIIREKRPPQIREKRPPQCIIHEKPERINWKIYK
jgi:hypothetical protein